MIRKPTLFVLSAGASFECGLPIGVELKQDIAKALDFRFDDSFGKRISGDETIFQSLRAAFPNDLDAYVTACHRIRDGVVLSSSIDDFIDLHRDDGRVTMCGKVAIVRSILQAERGSKLFFDERDENKTIDFSKIANTWFAAFYELLTRGVTRADLQHIFENVTVIIFNYDRCLEHFLVHALAATYGIPSAEARTLVCGLRILRPYGQVGAYLGPSDRAAVPFGSNAVPAVVQAIKTVRTYTEQIEDSSELASIQAAVSQAHVMVFLGSAFHATNLRLLTHPTAPSELRAIYFTRHDISDHDVGIVESRLAALRGKDHARKSGVTYLRADTCADLFFKEYRLALRHSVGG